jgi:hypothetical protein
MQLFRDAPLISHPHYPGCGTRKGRREPPAASRLTPEESGGWLITAPPRPVSGGNSDYPGHTPTVVTCFESRFGGLAQAAMGSENGSRARLVQAPDRERRCARLGQLVSALRRP